MKPERLFGYQTKQQRTQRKEQQARKKDILGIDKLSKDDSQFLTVMEAKKECMRIEMMYREQTEEMRENLAREELMLSLKRKYTNEFRFAIKFLMEQASLQLLLFSAAHKSNVFSILYLGLLLAMIIIVKKSTPMRYFVNAISISLVLKYVLILTNLTFANTPMGFPKDFEYYPCQNVLTNPDAPKEEQVYNIVCPDQNSMDSQKYLFPWYIRSDFLRDNLTWTMFLGIDLQLYKVNDMWFDFANLLLLSLYFFKFGNQSKVLSQSKVSFSKTSRLEKLLKLYSTYQKQHQAQLVGRLVADAPGKPKDAQSIADKDEGYSREAFLGPTFFLIKLKKQIFIYNFTKKMQIFSFVGIQIMTAIVIMTLAILHRSLMSIGYILMCIVLLMHMKEYFYQDKIQGKWINPYIFARPLLIYCFIDVAMQILYQYPEFPPQVGVNTRYLGFDKIYQDNQLGAIKELIPSNGIQRWVSELELQNLFFFMVKAMNLFFIFMQTRIYQSEGFSKFQRSKLRSLMMMGANYKRLIITYIYNNRKLQDIIRVQQKKKFMNDQLEELKDEIRVFQRQQKSLLWGLFKRRDEPEEPTVPQTASLNDDTKTSLIRRNNTIQDNEFQPEFFRKDITARQLERKPKTLEEKLLEQKSSVLKDLNTNFDMEKLHVLNEDDPNYEIKQKLYNKAQSKLGRCARWYMWINESYVNQVFFIESVDEATKIKEDCAKGILKSSNELKSAMKRDIDLIVTARLSKKDQKKIKKGQEYQIKLDDMPETSEFIKFSRISVALIESIPMALLSQAAALSYLSMILSMILNAGLVSILYPFAVFGYALMEEGRPKNQFWNMMSIYTIFVLVLKFIVQLDIWYAVGMDHTYYQANSYMILGLDRVDGILELALYVLPEFLVLMFVWAQVFYEILAGLHQNREIEVEDIQQARDRFLGQFNEQAIKVKMQSTLREPPSKQQEILKQLSNQQEEQKEEVSYYFIVTSELGLTK